MRALLATIRFLTILPTPGKCATTAEDFAGALWWFPVVGLGIGAAAAGLSWALWQVLPPLPAAVLLVLAMTAVSGALHMDGLADTADGFLSSRPKERILEIMKDSHIGAMGVIAIVGVLLLKVAALSPFVEWDKVWRVALLMPLAGRCVMVLAIVAMPYARPEGGLGALFGGSRSPWPAVWALLVLGGTGWLLASMAGLACLAVVLLVTLLFSLWSLRKIGGATGDTFGATCELCEVAVALTALAMLGCSVGRP